MTLLRPSAPPSPMVIRDAPPAAARRTGVDGSTPGPRVIGLGMIALLFTVLGLTVVAPWTGRGWLLLLDWTAGPRATLTNSAYGLDPSQMDAMPVRVLLSVSRMVVGPGATAWLPVLVFFPVAATGMARLVGPSTVRRLGAATLYVCNPFVVQRLQVGQVLVLGGYALLPWAARSFLAARASGRRFRVRSAGWLALMISVSPHMLWIGGVVLGATLVWPRPRRTDVVRAAVTVLSALGVYAYVVVTYLAGVHLQRVGPADLAAFPTAGGTTLGRLVNVATLQGFWRQASGGPVVGPSPWAIAAALLAGLVVVVGVRAGLRAPSTRALAVTALVAGSAGLVLALGASGPTGAFYRLTFDVVPFFRVMREAQKFTMLVAFAAAVLFGLGAERVVAGAAARRATLRPIAVVVLALVPLVTLPQLAWGLGGDVRLSRVPGSWAAADRIMGAGPGAVLFLPWHQYQAFPFTGGRTVRTPAAAHFSRPVIESDAVELPGLHTASTSTRSAYLEQLLARGGRITAFGRLVAPLGVRYVVLARTSTPAAYDWLDRQTDLTLVLDRPDLRVWRVAPSGTGRVVGARTVRDVDELVELANSGALGTEAVLAGPTSGGPGVPSTASGGLEADGPVRYRLDAGAPGWVVVPADAVGGWRLDGRRGVATLTGGLAFRAGTDVGVVAYRPWRAVRLGLVVSGLVLLALVAVGLVEHRGRVTRRSR